MAKFNFSFHLETEDQAEAVSFFAALSDALDQEMPDAESLPGISIGTPGKKERKKSKKHEIEAIFVPLSVVSDEHTDVSTIKNAMDAPAEEKSSDENILDQIGRSSEDLKKTLVKTLHEKADAHPDNASRMLAILGTYGAKRVSELKPELYAEVLSKFQSL